MAADAALAEMGVVVRLVEAVAPDALDAAEASGDDAFGGRVGCRLSSSTYLRIPTTESHAFSYVYGRDPLERAGAGLAGEVSTTAGAGDGGFGGDGARGKARVAGGRDASPAFSHGKRASNDDGSGRRAPPGTPP